VLPNGYCRIHQDQYVVEKEQDTRENEKEYLKVENDTPKNNIPEEKRENVAISPKNSKSYVKISNSSRRWYVAPIILMAFFWILSRLLKRKK
jgi:hypothetical protein